MEGKEAFEYTYSAQEQEELRKIREKYLPPEERATKMDQLRKLDASVTRKGALVSITVGTIFTLIMGIGMCFCMVWTDQLMIPGIIVGLIGMIGAALAYPLYKRITQKERERIAPQILKLTEELMQ